MHSTLVLGQIHEISVADKFSKVFFFFFFFFFFFNMLRVLMLGYVGICWDMLGTVCISNNLP